MDSHDPAAFAIRPANQEDATLASKLLFLSMGAELADYLFGGAHLPVEEILAGLFLLPGNRFSMDAVDVAVQEGQVVFVHSGYHRMVKDLI